MTTDTQKSALKDVTDYAVLVLGDISDQDTGWYYQLQAATQKATKEINKQPANPTNGQSTPGTVERVGHTPGPWEVSDIPVDEDTPIEIYHDDSGDPTNNGDPVLPHICHVNQSCCSQAQAIADARLIASAPDLLQACKALSHHAGRQLDQSATHDGIVNAEALAFARAAIAKATGKGV